MTTETIFSRHGGFRKVSKIVGAFYSMALQSPLMAPAFAGVDMARLMDHQTKFVAYLMGGPVSFTDEHLAHVHKRLNLTDEAFDEMATLFRYALEDNDLDETDIGTIVAAIQSKRPHIVFPND
jgi:hemoglobin